MRLPPTTPRTLCISYEFDLFTVRTYSMVCHTAARGPQSSPKRLNYPYPYQRLTYAIKTRLRAACGFTALYAPYRPAPTVHTSQRARDIAHDTTTCQASLLNRYEKTFIHLIPEMRLHRGACVLQSMYRQSDRQSMRERYT